MARKKYGVMPENPQLIARVRGDAGAYPVHGADWHERKILIYRATEFEWIPIEKVALESLTPEIKL